MRAALALWHCGTVRTAPGGTRATCPGIRTALGASSAHSNRERPELIDRNEGLVVPQTNQCSSHSVELLAKLGVVARQHHPGLLPAIPRLSNQSARGGPVHGMTAIGQDLDQIWN